MSRNEVPCNGCTACCKGQRIILSEYEEGEGYDMVPTVKGNNGKQQWMLRHKENGDCFYLGPDGCTIHERDPDRPFAKQPPRACREFDCRLWFANFEKSIDRKAVAESVMDGECARAAIRLLNINRL